jgi:hypothetical protein
MTITPTYLVFLLGTVAVPVIIVILNFVVRGVKNWYYTAGTDFLVAEMTFSFSSAILWKDMAPYIHNVYIREASFGIFLTLGLVILIAWVLSATYVETEINESIKRGEKSRNFRQLKLFLSWAMVIVFFSVEIMSFVSP